MFIDKILIFNSEERIAILSLKKIPDYALNNINIQPCKKCNTPPTINSVIWK